VAVIKEDERSQKSERATYLKFTHLFPAKKRRDSSLMQCETRDLCSASRRPFI
jgi:hypothetical protein